MESVFIQPSNNFNRFSICPWVPEDHSLAQVVSAEKYKIIHNFFKNKKWNFRPTAEEVLQDLVYAWIKYHDEECHNWIFLLLGQGVHFYLERWPSYLRNGDFNFFKNLWVYPMEDQWSYLYAAVDYDTSSEKAREMFQYWLDGGLVLSPKDLIKLSCFRWDWVDFWIEKHPNWPLAEHLSVENNQFTPPNLLFALCVSHICDKKKDMSWRQNDQRQWLERLLDAGIDINAIDEHGCSALYLAAGSENPHLVLDLLERGATPHLNKDGFSFLHRLFNYNQNILVCLPDDYGLINHQNVLGQTPCHFLGAPIGKMSLYFPLEYFPLEGNQSLLPALKWSLEQGANLHIQDNEGIPAWLIMLLAEPELINVLLEQKIDLNWTHSDGSTLLDLLSYQKRGWVAMRVLLDHGVEPYVHVNAPPQLGFEPIRENIAKLEQYTLSQSTSMPQQETGKTARL